VTAGVLDDGNACYTPGISEVRSGTTTYSHSGLKHLAAQSCSGASVSATRGYDAFGGVASSSGSWQGPFGSAGAFGYQTESSGLHLLGHRYYDASLGRFLTRDPNGDGSNWYVYCENSPNGNVDSGGLIIETLVDLVGIGLDLKDIWDDPGNGWAWAGLGWSVGATLIPGAPGSWAGRGAKAVGGAVDAGRARKAANAVADTSVDGCVYVLKEPGTGIVRYPGQTSRKLKEREQEHRRSKPPFDIEVFTYEPDLNKRLLIEQDLIDNYGLDNLWNKRNAVSPKRRNLLMEMIESTKKRSKVN
jgi:RHS repeat-associated protein